MDRVQGRVEHPPLASTKLETFGREVRALWFFLQIMLGGLSIGAIYSLIGLGFSMLWSAMGIVNFAHGEFAMLGAFLGVTLMKMAGLPFYASFPLTAVLIGLFSLLVDRAVLRPLRNRDLLYIVIATLGLSIFLQNGAILVWGAGGMLFPTVFGAQPLQIGGLITTPQTLSVLGIGILLMLGLQVFLAQTKIGFCLRAAVQSPETASLMGIETRFTNALTFFLAALLAAIAGMFIAPIVYVTPDMGVLIGLKGFSAAVVGGYGNMLGAMVGGIIIGAAETLGAQYLSSAYKDVFAFLAMFIVLLVSPNGLFGKRKIDRT
jgi:branched-chain amino acid transport system permease protein